VLPETAVCEELWLLGQPPLGDYLGHVRRAVIGGAELHPASLVDEWRAANDIYYELEQSEGGAADKVEVRELDAALRPLAARVAATPAYARAFDQLPARFAMVELDRLIVSQPHIDLAHAARLQARLGVDPSARTVFEFCHPLERPSAPVQMRRAGSKRYLFWSPSNDLRFLEASVLRRAEVPPALENYGPVAGVLALVAGFGSNFVSLIQSDNRLLLHNGHHRAYALRALGITHAPAVIQTVTRRDELNLVASSEVVDEPGFYFKAARPPLLKDLFDPRLAKVLRVKPSVRVVEITFETKEFEIDDFGIEDGPE
jgi:hypothetical protein